MTNKISATRLAITHWFIVSPGTRLVYLFFLLALLGSVNPANAQDLLILTSGEEIKANIVEEGSDFIKYRDYNDPAGPLYSIAKDKVATIKYRKGYRSVTDEQAGKEILTESQ